MVANGHIYCHLVIFTTCAAAVVPLLRMPVELILKARARWNDGGIQNPAVAVRDELATRNTRRGSHSIKTFLSMQPLPPTLLPFHAVKYKRAKL